MYKKVKITLNLLTQKIQSTFKSISHLMSFLDVWSYKGMATDGEGPYKGQLSAGENRRDACV